MHDDEIMAQQDDLLRLKCFYEKYGQYHGRLHFLKAPWSLNEDQLHELWHDSLESMFFNKIMLKKVVKKVDGPDWLYPLLFAIARGKALNLLKKLGRPPIQIDGDIEPEESDFRGDILILRTLIEQLEEPARTVLLLRYFPDTPEIAAMTEAQLCQFVDGDEQMSQPRFKYYKLKGIAQLGKLYQALYRTVKPKPGMTPEEAAKQHLEKAITGLNPDIINFINANFPQATLLGKFLNPSNSAASQAAACEATSKSGQLDFSPRHRLYPEHARRILRLLSSESPDGQLPVFEEKYRQVLRFVVSLFH